MAVLVNAGYALTYGKRNILLVGLLDNVFNYGNYCGICSNNIVTGERGIRLNMRIIICNGGAGNTNMLIII